MNEPNKGVIPYATPGTGAIEVEAPSWARHLFGLIVRTAGLAITLWGFYTVVYLAIHVAVNEPIYESRASMFMFAVFLLLAGFALLRGEWLVRFAYGPARLD